MIQWDVLRQQCPRLYKHGIAFECGLGWFDLLRDLSIKLEKVLEKDAERDPIPEGEEDNYIEMFAVQVKEKYGTLRFYMSCENEEIAALIRETEALSSEICELCGSHAEMRGNHWYAVRCDKCYEEERS